MSIFRGSRYRSVPTIQIQDSDGEAVEVFEIRKTVDTHRSTYPTIQAKAGDTMESLAAKHYKDANKWYVIADANPEIFFPLDLEAGNVIRIPPASVAAVQ